MGIVDGANAVASTPFPKLLWKYYLEYLWYYDPNSWVAKTANTARILAILVALPIIILALLDISSYGIARTLGVIDDVKASTSDIVSIHADQAVLENNGGDTNSNLSHPSSTAEPSDTDGVASPARSDDESYPILPADTVPDISAGASSEEQLVDHTSHNLRMNDSLSSLAQATSNTRGFMSNSDSALHQRRVINATYDP